MKLEEMQSFFDSRLNIYDSHQLNCISNAKEFYPITASLLPKCNNCKVLDLGCGTGLELEPYFKINPTAVVTCIDIASKMLEMLKLKFKDKSINVINSSYLDIEYGEKIFDAAVSVESFHHYSAENKINIYKKIYKSLKQGGFLIITDYFAENNEEESKNFRKLKQTIESQKLDSSILFHYDTPLTLEHEIQSIKNGGFKNVELLYSFGKTSVIKAS